jgi:hypothetical protein
LGDCAWLYHGAARLSVSTLSSSSCSSASRLVAVEPLASSYQHQFTTRCSLPHPTCPLTACVTSCLLDCTVRKHQPQPPRATFGAQPPQHGPAAQPSSVERALHPHNSTSTTLSPSHLLTLCPLSTTANTTRYPHTPPDTHHHGRDPSQARNCR